MSAEDDRLTEYEKHEQWRASCRDFAKAPFKHWRELIGVALLVACLAVFATAAGAEKATTQSFSGFAFVITASFLAFHDQRRRAHALQRRVDLLEQQVRTSGRQGPRLDYQKGHVHVHGNSVTLSLEHKNAGDDVCEAGCWNVKIWWADLGDHPHYAESVSTAAVRPGANGEIVFEFSLGLPPEAPVYLIVSGMWFGGETKLINHGIDHLKWARPAAGKERTLSTMTDGERHSVSKYVVNKMKVARHPRLEAISEKGPESGLPQEVLRQLMEATFEVHGSTAPKALRTKPSLVAN